MMKIAKRTNEYGLSMMGYFRKTQMMAQHNLQLIVQHAKEEFVFAIFRKKTFS
ncbi:MAG: hypothetical protein ABJN36_00515 [Cyclobacteriaceae bacterium]